MKVIVLRNVDFIQALPWDEPISANLRIDEDRSNLATPLLVMLKLLMGWNTSALFVAARKPKELIAFLPDIFQYKRTRKKVGGDQATSSSPGDRLYVRELNGWCEMWEPNQHLLPKIEIILEDAPTTLLGTKALVIILSSVTSTYGFLLFDDGALVRKTTYKYGKCVEAIGEPLAFEADFDEERGYDEDFVWTAVRAVTGRGPDLEGSYDVYNVIDD